MNWRGFRRAVQKDATSIALPVSVRYDDDGIVVSTERNDGERRVAAFALLEELADEGTAAFSNGEGRITWADLYALLNDPAREADLPLLGLPDEMAAVPRLSSRGPLTDATFAVAIEGWQDAERRTIGSASLCGGVLEVAGVPHLMNPSVWHLVDRIRRFARRDAAARTEVAQRLAWGEIRQHAVAVGAGLDAFLYGTVVLTPDRLQLSLRRSEALGLVEVEPWFEGAPAGWLNAFDKSGQVRDRYDLPTPEGIVQVMIAPAVATVLREVKRMPGRRFAGQRAEAILVNPVAALGPDAGEVLDTDAFEASKIGAGIVFDRFAALTPETHGANTLGLLVTSSTGGGIATREIALHAAEAAEFASKVEDHLTRGMQLCLWDEYEFELDGDSAIHCAALRRAIDQSRASLISHGEVYDLSGYSERVDGIGQEKAFYSPHIAKRNTGEGWVPDNLAPMIGWIDPQSSIPTSLPLTPQLAEELRAQIDDAQKNGSETIAVRGCPVPMPVREAAAIIDTFERVSSAAAAGSFDPEHPRKGRRPTLILKSNIEHVDYREERLSVLNMPASEPRLPASLRPGVALKPHQAEGLAWMQHLLSLAPEHCRGALLADDMGLGKTLQILSLIARVREDDPGMPPALVVAPLSLLENWREESEKFLDPGSIRLLTAYGADLKTMRVAKTDVDEQLRREGLVRFLKPDWRKDVDVVLTTYETLRDLEFSFARERWSIMVCDEAQKIKNPNAAVTRAAKKLNATFRIACTGTPVENSLVDLWCLFDFVQPGLLGALNGFGSRYRRPIEAKDDEDRARIDELRRLIAPQLLRRMKAEVATDLKAKIEDAASRSLPMSHLQRSLYVGAVEGFRTRDQRSGAAQLGLLHRLRMVCSEPRQLDEASSFELLPAYRKQSPKLDWLLTTLERVRAQGEKAIIFCEYKAVQRLLRHYLREVFHIRVDVINGDTSAAADHVDSRQKRIRAFQEQPGFGVIILSPVAVGFGVNMQAANHVVHFTRTWNPAKEDQATDRAYRIGQEKDVHVYYPTIAAEDFKTFDVRLDELLSRKRDLASDMLNGAGEIRAEEFGIEELNPSA